MKIQQHIMLCFPLDNSTPFCVLFSDGIKHTTEFKETVLQIPSIDITTSINSMDVKIIKVQIWGRGMYGWPDAPINECEIEKVLFDKDLNNMLE